MAKKGEICTRESDMKKSKGKLIGHMQGGHVGGDLSLVVTIKSQDVGLDGKEEKERERLSSLPSLPSSLMLP